MKFQCVCMNWIEITGKLDQNNVYSFDQIMCPVCGYVWNPNHSQTTHCFGAACGKNTIFRIGHMEGPYGHACGDCGKTLREHPFFGEFQEYDKGDLHKWAIWKSLTNMQKVDIYTRYGFDPPRHLFQ